MAASSTPSDIDRIAATQDDLAHETRELTEKIEALADRLNTPYERPIDRHKDADALIAHLEAVSEMVMRGRVFTESSTDIVRKFRGYDDTNE